MDKVKEQAKMRKQIIDALKKIKSIVSVLNETAAKHELLKVDMIKDKPITSLLQISVECDEQIAVLQDANKKQ
jgi:hypothetical protein